MTGYGQKPGIPCASCAQPLLLDIPGRTVCERCRLAATRPASTLTAPPPPPVARNCAGWTREQFATYGRDLRHRVVSTSATPNPKDNR